MPDQTQPAAPLISIENLRVEFRGEYGPIIGVEDISFTIQPGETVCVVGESGSGKSVTSLSLLRLVEFGGGRIVSGNLWFQPQGGERIDLAQIAPEDMTRLRGNQIGMIFQEPMTALNPVFRIGRQLTDGLRRHRGLTGAAAEARALELLQEVRLPEPARRLRQYPHELSGGMRQRVVIAMAMACRPQLLIADEPTTALDVTIQAEILGLIGRLKRELGMAVMFITHDMAVVAQLADRVVVMRHGKLVEQGRVEQIFSAPKADYTKTLLASVPKLGEMRGKSGPEPLRIPGAPEPAVIRSALVPADPARPILSVKGLSTRFPMRSGLMRRVVSNVHAVENVSFDIAQGETLALVGESGCGKSTTARSILRLVEPSAGEIRMDGQDIRSLNQGDLRLARRNMQMVFQDPFASLNPFMRLRKQVAEPMMNFNLATGSELEDRIAFLFDRVGLPRDFLRRFPHELSGGQRQRVAIARALSVNPKLIVADEAVSALDVSVQAQVLNLFMELQAEFGLSYLFISHDMAVVERISHRVGVMYLGRIVEIGARSDVFENPQHSYTRALLSGVPIADPSHRMIKENLEFKPLPSPIFPVGYQAARPTYNEIAQGHLVLQE